MCGAFHLNLHSIRLYRNRDNFLFYYKSAENLYDKPNGVVRVDDSSLRFAENPTKKDLKDQWLLCIELPNNNESIKHNSFYVAGEDADLQEWKDRITESAGYWTKRSMRKK